MKVEQTTGLEQRVAKLSELGGLPPVPVRNDEWLYMLQEETRQSLSIEGYFATDTELKAILSGRRSGPEILNYFRAAQGIYDLALQNHRDGEWLLSLSLIRHIHSELFRELDSERGLFRRGGIRIQGAKVRPPELGAEDYVRVLLDLAPELLAKHSTLAALARIHVLFEAIHPFRDGNGRTGRILLNYLAIGKGWPPIIIKGEEPEDRQRYYLALEHADRGFHAGFPPADKEALRRALEQGDFTLLEELLASSVIPQLEALIVAALEAQGNELQTLRALAEVSEMGIKEATLRQWVTRGRLIAVKRGGRLYSHPALVL